MGFEQLYGHRTPEYVFQLLDEHNNVVDRLLGVTGGSLQVNANTQLGVSGLLRIMDVGQRVDWLRQRVRILYDPGVPGVEPWAVATCMFASPVEHISGGRVTFEVALLSLLTFVSEDAVDAVFSIPAGTNYVDTAVQLLRGAGVSNVNVTASERVNKSAMMWEAGTSKLKIVNELLSAAGYWGVKPDAWGAAVVAPWLAPAARAIVHDFREGADSLHAPQWRREFDLSKIPNQVIVKTFGSQDVPAIVGVSRNENPDSPYSFQARGRWVTLVVDNLELADQQVADATAQRKLLEAMSPVSSLFVRHAVLPLTVNDVVRFRSDGRNLVATVQHMEFDLSFAGLVSAHWREVLPSV